MKRNRFCRPILSLILAAVLLFVSAVPAQAEENIYSGDFCSGSGVDDTGLSYFHKGEQQFYLSDIEGIVYDWTFTRQPEDSAFVTFSFSVKEGDQLYSGKAEGNVCGIWLPSGRLLWEGPLTGSLEINGVAVPVILGFARLDGSSQVQASVTIQHTEETLSMGLPYMFLIGGGVITSEINAELDQMLGESRAKREASGEEAQAVLASVLYTLKASSAVNLANDLYGDIAQTLRCYYYQTGKRCAVSTQSNTEAVVNYYGASTTTVATVSYMKIRLYRSNSADPSYIAGIETFDVPNPTAYFSNTLQYIKLLIEDALSLIGAPSAGLLASIDSMRTTMSRAVATNDYSVSFSFPANQFSDFDDASQGIPIVFQLAGGTSSYGHSYYYAKTDMTYRARYMPSGASSFFTAYLISNTASVLVGLQVY